MLAAGRVTPDHPRRVIDGVVLHRPRADSLT
jgi:hypothetical protein